METIKELLINPDITKLSDLTPNRIYKWTMGAEDLEVKYMGPVCKFRDLKVGSKVGHGFIFQWVKSPKPSYIEVSLKTIFKYIKNQ